MTRSSYIFANLLKTVGYPFARHRLKHAAKELQLLREAEIILGFYAWENLQDLPNLEEDADAIQDIFIQKEKIYNEIHSWQTRVANANNSAPPEKKAASNELQRLTAQQSNISNRLETIISKSSGILQEAKKVKNNFDKKNSQLKILKDNNEDEQTIHTAEEELSLIKSHFTQLKTDQQKNEQTRSLYLKKIEDIKNKIQALSEPSNSNPEPDKKYTIGQAKQKIANLQQQAANIEKSLTNNYSQIGKKVSINYYSDKNYRLALQGKSYLIKVMAALRRSIAYNHEIAGR